MAQEIFVNEDIRSQIVILISADGQHRGQFLKTAAIQLARDEGKDLVQMSPARPDLVAVGNTVPPVCKIIDSGKMRFDRNKMEKKKHHSPVRKEIRFNPKIAAHDMDVKVKKIRELLAKGHTVGLAMELKGRQKFAPQHRDNGRVMLTAVVASLTDCASASPIKEGEGLMSVSISPVGSVSKSQ